VLDGGAAKAQVRAQQAVLAQTRATYQNTVLTALKEVEDALIALQHDRERLRHLQQAASAADNAALLAQNRYSSGLIDFQTVLQTQRTLLGAQDSVAGVQADLSSGHVRLIKAMGGGW
jgi:outer membrane protein TolC